MNSQSWWGREFRVPIIVHSLTIQLRLRNVEYLILGVTVSTASREFQKMSNYQICVWYVFRNQLQPGHREHESSPVHCHPQSSSASRNIGLEAFRTDKTNEVGDQGSGEPCCRLFYALHLLGCKDSLPIMREASG